MSNFLYPFTYLGSSQACGMFDHCGRFSLMVTVFGFLISFSPYYFDLRHVPIYLISFSFSHLIPPRDGL